MSRPISGATTSTPHTTFPVEFEKQILPNKGSTTSLDSSSLQPMMSAPVSVQHRPQLPPPMPRLIKFAFMWEGTLNQKASLLEESS